MGVQDTWMGLTITAMVLMFSLQLVQVWGTQLKATNGAENVTITDQEIHYSFLNSPINSSNTKANDEASWVETISKMFSRGNEPEQETGGADYSQTNWASLIYDVFVNGTVGFSSYIHNLLGLQEGMGYLHTYLILFVQWFLVIGNAMIIMQIIGKFLPGG